MKRKMIGIYLVSGILAMQNPVCAGEIAGQPLTENTVESETASEEVAEEHEVEDTVEPDESEQAESHVTQDAEIEENVEESTEVKEEDVQIDEYTLDASGDAGEEPIDDIEPAAQAQEAVLYRAYNPNTGEHLYTKNASEIPFVVNAGWRNEGTAWTAPTQGKAVYRMFNPNNGGDHFYTLNAKERDHLKSVGWNYEGISWYSGGQVPVYRLYNPYASSGTHHYTTSSGERDSLKRVGWKDEGIAFYATAAASAQTVTDTASKQVDVGVTGIGGEEKNNPGSYRMLYSNKAFDKASLTGAAAIEFSADVALTGSSSDYETQFVIGGTNGSDGQIGVELHYQAGSDSRFAQGRINVTNINFPAGAGIKGQQYYSVNTSAPRVSNGQSVQLKVKYFSSGYMQTYVNGSLTGQYKTKLNTTNNTYILHDTTNAPVKIRNIKVLKNGEDVTATGAVPFGSTSFDFSSGSISGAY